MEGITTHLTTSGIAMRAAFKLVEMEELGYEPREDLDQFTTCYLMSVSGLQYLHA